jgi:hypothetical protein
MGIVDRSRQLAPARLARESYQSSFDHCPAGLPQNTALVIFMMQLGAVNLCCAAEARGGRLVSCDKAV